MNLTYKEFPKRHLEWLGWDEGGKDIGVCQGDCDKDEDCQGDLICSHDKATHLAGCFGSPESLETLRDDSYWFEADFCVENPKKIDLSWVGDYGDRNTFFGNGGSYVDTNNRIHLYGNVWKAYYLETPYTVTGNTHVSFKFQMIKEAEGHAICFDDDLVSDTYGGYQKRCIAIGGTEFDRWDSHHVEKVVLDKNDSDTGTLEVAYEIKIGNFFNRKGTKVNFVGFIQDNDADPYEGISSFWDIQFFEVEVVSFSHS